MSAVFADLVQCSSSSSTPTTLCLQPATLRGLHSAQNRILTGITLFVSLTLWFNALLFTECYLQSLFFLTEFVQPHIAMLWTDPPCLPQQNVPLVTYRYEFGIRNPVYLIVVKDYGHELPCVVWCRPLLPNTVISFPLPGILCGKPLQLPSLHMTVISLLND